MHTNTSVLGLMLSLWLSISGQAAAQSSSALTNLRPEHPRLLFTQATVSSRKQLIASDPVAKGMYDDIKKKGEDLVKKDETGQYSNSLVTYTVVGGRLLDMSRRALGNIETLAGLLPTG